LINPPARAPAAPPPPPKPAAELEDEELEADETTKALLAQIVSRSINEACHGAQAL
jgi:3-oxoacyl-ACP reductase-like protein